MYALHFSVFTTYGQQQFWTSYNVKFNNCCMPNEVCTLIIQSEQDYVKFNIYRYFLQ